MKEHTHYTSTNDSYPASVLIISLATRQAIPQLITMTYSPQRKASVEISRHAGEKDLRL